MRYILSVRSVCSLVVGIGRDTRLSSQNGQCTVPLSVGISKKCLHSLYAQTDMPHLANLPSLTVNIPKTRQQLRASPTYIKRTSQIIHQWTELLEFCSIESINQSTLFPLTALATQKSVLVYAKELTFIVRLFY